MQRSKSIHILNQELSLKGMPDTEKHSIVKNMRVMFSKEELS